MILLHPAVKHYSFAFHQRPLKKRDALKPERLAGACLIGNLNAQALFSAGLNPQLSYRSYAGADSANAAVKFTHRYDC
jgi:hypothetical protein